MNARTVVVVGGGISGLAAAHALVAGDAPGADSSSPRRTPRVIVLEGATRLGGKLAGDVLEGVPVDLGAESVLARRPEAVDLIRAVGLGNDVVHPATTSAGLWIGNRILPIPPTVMGVPVDPAATVDVLGEQAAARVAREAELPEPALTEDVAIGRFVADRMGPAVTDKLIDPLLGGVYAGRADEISLAAAVPELYAKLRTAPSVLAATAELRATSRRRAADGSPVFAGIRGGINRLVQALEADLTARGVEIRRSTTVRRISRGTDDASGTSAGRYVLETGPVPAPQLVHADAVIVATPASPAARMLAQLVPAASAELATIDYASMAIVTLAVRKSDWPAGTTGSGFLVPSVEGRTIKASTYSHAKWQWSAEAGGDLAVLRCSVGRLGEEYVLQRSDEELVALAAADLKTAIGLDAPVVGALVSRWGGGLPQYAVGHLDRIDRVEAAVAEQPGLAVCGAAYRGVGIAACVASAGRAVTRVRSHLDALATMGS
ncbi:protoporphyrinogen oxidase [Kribbella flavida DSM 17836]|uniref:Coproporphyrinogen III oxidase n=1 Tax=Kribbella flavida (strain DSM 17836 / JCM 10339 / NBRC 14399) TaxID=479435 RepID=D2PNW5_KRIFD|nr:protoporphyrinogen oxidase [Kribbella flavida]ADB32783.1 protoporphyrinogen oxidase [Kribbella flavida DSM 17836]